jgi:hypothetical protein
MRTQAFHGVIPYFKKGYKKATTLYSIPIKTLTFEVHITVILGHTLVSVVSYHDDEALCWCFSHNSSNFCRLMRNIIKIIACVFRQDTAVEESGLKSITDRN